MGAALIQICPETQEERIISFASKALTPAEQRYANIEREYLAVVYGVEKFHTYLYGSDFTVNSDHSPLEKIHMKDLADTPPRLQRMKLRLQCYRFELIYKKGSKMALADYLSRHAPGSDRHTLITSQTIHSIQWSANKLDALRIETNRDPVLSSLRDIVVTGWPEKNSQLPEQLRKFWNVKDFISVDDGILLKGRQVVIPPSLRSDILSQIHSHCHQGIEKTRLLARQCVYWPGMNNDIEILIKDCDSCNKCMSSQQKEPMYERNLPSGPWEMLGSDLCELDGKHYVLLKDYYSKFTFVRELNRLTSTAVIKQLKSIFSEHGVPVILFSDNGPCYDSAEFQQFADRWGFTHIPSSPHYQQSNGLAEVTVKAVKKIFKCARDNGEDPELALLFVRSTPIDSNLPSPAELLYDRPIRSTLPQCFKFNDKNERTNEILRQRQLTQKRFYDKTALNNELADLDNGAPVMVQEPKHGTWNNDSECKSVYNGDEHSIRGSVVMRQDFNSDHGNIQPVQSEDKPMLESQRHLNQLYEGYSGLRNQFLLVANSISYVMYLYVPDINVDLKVFCDFHSNLCNDDRPTFSVNSNVEVVQCFVFEQSYKFNVQGSNPVTNHTLQQSESGQAFKSDGLMCHIRRIFYVQFETCRTQGRGLTCRVQERNLPYCAQQKNFLRYTRGKSLTCCIQGRSLLYGALLDNRTFDPGGCNNSFMARYIHVHDPGGLNELRPA